MFSDITTEILSDLDSINLNKYEYIKAEIEQEKLTPPLVTRRFSDIAFSLAKKSLKTGIPVPIAVHLSKIFQNYLDSQLISLDTKARMKPLISETELDFLYASGSCHISSLRLMPYITSQNT